MTRNDQPAPTSTGLKSPKDERGDRWPKGLAIAVWVLPALLLGGCEPWILDPAGQVGTQERIILIDSLAIMLAIVIPTILATLAFAFWYRAGNTKARYAPDFVYSGRLELLVWSIPALVILFLGGIIWVGSHDLDPAKPLAGQAVEVDVVAMDWKWLFLYPQQGLASVNQLIIPAGRPIHFKITSASVFNSFFVPRMGSQIYAMPGMVSQLNLVADHTGQYHGLSAHFSGDGFSGMGFEVHAVTGQQFAAWANGARGKGKTLDQAALRSLLKPTSNIQPYTYSATVPGLFDSVVTQNEPRAKVPPAGAEAAVHPMETH